MRPSCRHLIVFALAAIPAACAESPITAPITSLPRALTAGERQVVDADNRFAFAFMAALAGRQGPAPNLFVSPVSVAMALGMTVNGAVGATRDSMLHALQLDGVPIASVNAGYRGLIDLLRGLDGEVDFTLANSLWARAGHTIGQDFLADVRAAFDADVRTLDFASPAAAATINDWVNARTRGRIPTIIDGAIPDGTILYLINAIYFKGSWTQRFDPALTHDAPFTLRGGGASQVPMMTHRDPAPARLYRGGGVTVVDLPYGRRAWAMTIVLPDPSVGIDSLVTMLTEERWNDWMAGLDSAAVVVTMPKFTLRYDDTLNADLATLGMGIAFRCEAADFTRLLPNDTACITKVRHKTFLDVDEEGTTAAAVTSVEVGVTSAPSGPLHIAVDRPFVVAIRERLSGTILFLGRITDPAAP